MPCPVENMQCNVTSDICMGSSGSGYLYNILCLEYVIVNNQERRTHIAFCVFFIGLLSNGTFLPVLLVTDPRASEVLGVTFCGGCLVDYGSWSSREVMLHCLSVKVGIAGWTTSACQQGRSVSTCTSG